MATCKNCGKSGIFLAIDKIGVCKYCAPYVETMLLNNVRYIKDYLPLLDHSVIPHTFMGNIAAVEDSFNILLEYEQKGIHSFTNPSVKQMVVIFKEKKDNLIAELFENARQALDMKVYYLKTPKAKIGRYEKFLLEMDQAEDKLINKHALDDIRAIVHKSIQMVEKDSLQIQPKKK